MLRYVNCSWYNFYNFLLNMGITVHAQSIFYFTRFSEILYEEWFIFDRDWYGIWKQVGRGFFCQIQTTRWVQGLAYTGSFLFPLSNDQLWTNFNLRARHFREFRESLVVQNFFTANQPSSQVWVVFIFQVIFILIAKIVRRKTNLFSVNREIRSSQIKVGFHYIEVLTKYMFCKMLH